MKLITSSLLLIGMLSSMQVLAYSESDLPIHEPKVSSCSEKIQVAGCPAVAKKFFEWFDPSFVSGSLYSCMEKAAKKAGYTGTVNKFYIAHSGIHVLKKTNSPQRGKIWSLHSFGRAIDIRSVTVKGSSGNLSYNYPKFCQNEEDSTNKHTRFYRRLRQCWSRTHGSAPYGIGSYYASITCEHSGHRSHMHLSLPYSMPRSMWNDIALE